MNQSKTSLIVEDSRTRALSVVEVAAELGVSEQLVRLEIRREQLKASRFGRRIVIRREDLDAYLAARVIR